MAGIERLMAEKGTAEAVAGAEAPVQAPAGETFPDSQGAIAEAERILGEARDPNAPITPDVYISPSGVEEAVTAQTADTTSQGPTPPVGEGGRGGGTEGPQGLEPPEGPPQPPDRNNLEFEASPERGREIAEEIVKWEALRAVGRYNEVDWPRLDQLYREQIIHTEAFGLVSLRVKPFEGGEQLQQIGQEIINVDPENLTGLSPLGDLIEAYNRGAVTPEQMPEFQRQVSAYFGEAKRIGLLRDLDAILSSVYERQVKAGIRRNRTSDEIMSGTDGAGQRIQLALNSLTEIYRDRRWIDPEIVRLVGVGELYTQFARGRFTVAINNRDPDGVTQRPYAIENEFRLDLEEVDETLGENYWRTTWGTYVEVYAQTEEEFMIAADDFISKLEFVTSDPRKIIEQSMQFVDMSVRSEGAKRLLQTNPDFISELILGIEARVGVFGADATNELYNNDYYKQYMDYINKDGKGPDRWQALTRLLNGKVAAALWALDKDPRWEILFSLFGSRGQLAKASDAQRMGGSSRQGLFWQVRDLFIEEMMGVALKDRRNVANLTKWMSDREFTNLFDGLYRYGKVPEDRSPGDANINAYKLLEEKLRQEGKPMPEDRQLTAAQRLGKIQLAFRRGEKLSTSDQRFYQNAWDEAEKAFGIAFQMYGALGEKSKRAGGVFTVNKVDGQGRSYQDFVPVHYTEKFVQFAETWTKMKYAEDAVIWSKPEFTVRLRDSKNYPNFRARYRAAMVEIARVRAIRALRRDGFEATLFDADYNADYLAKAKDYVGKLNQDNLDQIERFQEGQTTSMLLKRPKEYEFKKDDKGKIITEGVPAEVLADELDRDANKNVIVEEAPVTFYIATHHPYGDWTSHTYWSYQEEDRHRILSPVTLAQARKIKSGELRPEDANPWATQLLIIDPTLKRVRRFVRKHYEERERKLTAAAVEDSYQSHWRITKELYRAFFPKYGTPTSEIGIYYGLQDYGGFRKMIEHSRARFAEDPERYTRRGRRLIPDIHIPAAALSEIWGQGTVGALGVMRMFGTPIYRMGGAFALDKFAAQAEIAGMLYEALSVTKKDNEGYLVEPLLLKLTNNSDKLSEVVGSIPDPGKPWQSISTQNKFCYALIESLGRLQRYEKLLSTMETLIRNASGALWLENVDVLKDNGQLNPEIERRFRALPDMGRDDLTREDLASFIREAEVLEEMGEEEFNRLFNSGDEKNSGIDEGGISSDTGSGRHSARIVHDTFGQLLVDAEKRGGVELYPGEKFPYSRIYDKIIIVPPEGRGEPKPTNETIWDFIFSKFVPT